MNYRMITLMYSAKLNLHFSVVRYGGLSLHLHGMPKYLHGLVLRVQASDCWWCLSIDHLLYILYSRIIGCFDLVFNIIYTFNSKLWLSVLACTLWSRVVTYNCTHLFGYDWSCQVSNILCTTSWVTLSSLMSVSTTHLVIPGHYMKRQQLLQVHCLGFLLQVFLQGKEFLWIIG